MFNIYGTFVAILAALALSLSPAMASNPGLGNNPGVNGNHGGLNGGTQAAERRDNVDGGKGSQGEVAALLATFEPIVVGCTIKGKGYSWAKQTGGCPSRSITKR